MSVVNRLSIVQNVRRAFIILVQMCLIFMLICLCGMCLDHKSPVKKKVEFERGRNVIVEGGNFADLVTCLSCMMKYLKR